MDKLYIMNGPDKGKSFDLKGNTISVGRSPDNDIQIRGKTLSRKHLKILRKEDKYFIEDLNSRNGTFVKGKQISSGNEFEVKQGLPIALGKIMICLGPINYGENLAFPETTDLSKEFSEAELAILNSIDFSKELTEAELAILNSTDLSKQLAVEAESFAQDRPMTPQKNMELIYKVSKVLMESVTMDGGIHEILKKILNYILDLLKRVDRGVFILMDNETGEISKIIPILKKGSYHNIKMYSRTIVDRVVREGKPVMMLDTIDEDETDLSESIESMKVRSVMCVPLITRSKVRGVIYVDSVTKPHGFRREDLSLLTALSVLAALAIESSLLYPSKDSGKLN